MSTEQKTDEPITDLYLRPLRYAVMIAGKWVYIERQSEGDGYGWVARRSQSYACSGVDMTVEWIYKQYTVWKSPKAAAEMAAAARRGAGWSTRWNGEMVTA